MKGYCRMTFKTELVVPTQRVKPFLRLMVTRCTFRDDLAYEVMFKVCVTHNDLSSEWRP